MSEVPVNMQAESMHSAAEEAAAAGQLAGQVHSPQAAYTKGGLRMSYRQRPQTQHTATRMKCHTIHV